MSYVIVVCPKLSDRVSREKTYFFLGYKHGVIQTTDRLGRAAVVADSAIDHLIKGLQKKSDHVYTKQVSDRRVNWTMQRLRIPKKVKARVRKSKAQHFPKIRAVKPRELVKRYAEYCSS